MADTLEQRMSEVEEKLRRMEYENGLLRERVATLERESHGHVSAAGGARSQGSAR
jgi:hypothetical protein